MRNDRILQGQTALITGASQGLGYEIAKHYLAAGANLMLCARDAALLERARDSLQALATPGQLVLARETDVSNQLQVQALVDTTLAQFCRLDILVNNAGVYGPMGALEAVDWHEWLRAIEINLFGSVLMCRAVMPHFKRVGRGKIIQLSGGGATNPMPMISAYAVSKAAVVRFIESLALEVQHAGIAVNAIAPGALNTRMLQQVLDAGPKKVGADFHARALTQQQTGGAALEKGAALALFLASAYSDGITGKLISALWDPWQSFPEHLAELEQSDIYNLRRIVPADRGMAWGEV